MKGLTKRQHEILEFIKDFIIRHQYSPSYREIMEHFNFSSLGSVHKHLAVLKRKGFLTSEKKCSRSLTLTSEFSETEPAKEVEASVIGYISAGMPIETLPHAHTIAIPHHLSGNIDKTYVLKARGDSLNDELIADEDLVIVEARSEAQPGEYVVALINHQETTIKRWYPEGQYVRLESDHPHHQPVIVRKEDITVQGVMIGLLRQY